jgi:hypothetical protein
MFKNVGHLYVETSGCKAIQRSLVRLVRLIANCSVWKVIAYHCSEQKYGLILLEKLLYICTGHRLLVIKYSLYMNIVSVKYQYAVFDLEDIEELLFESGWPYTCVVFQRPNSLLLCYGSQGC